MSPPRVLPSPAGRRHSALGSSPAGPRPPAWAWGRGPWSTLGAPSGPRPALKGLPGDSGEGARRPRAGPGAWGAGGRAGAEAGEEAAGPAPVRLRCRRRAGCGWPCAAAPHAGPRAPPGPAASPGPPWPPQPPGREGRPRRPARRSWPPGAEGRGSAPGGALRSAVSPGHRALRPVTRHITERPTQPLALRAGQAMSAHTPAPHTTSRGLPATAPLSSRRGPRGPAGQLTLSGEPEATLAKPRSTCRRTPALGSFCRAARLSSSDSRSSRSFATLLLSSCGQRRCDRPPPRGPPAWPARPHRPAGQHGPRPAARPADGHAERVVCPTLFPYF